MKTKAVFIDRDGTINIDNNYVFRVQDFEFIPDAIKGLKLLQEIGFKLIVITNQSGIARGYYTEEDYKELNQWMERTLRSEYGIEIAASYYCPHHPEAIINNYRKECNCRKPKVGLFEKAIIDKNIDTDNSYAIGDKLRDLSVCEKYEKMNGFLVGQNETEEIINRVKRGEIKNIKYAESLYTAALEILDSAQYTKI